MSNASNRFYGKVGYISTVEDEYGVSRPVATERYYYGTVLTLATKWQVTQNLNDDIEVNHQISIVADPYAFEKFFLIRYVEWMGTLWEVKRTQVNYPRLILTLGGVYNGEQTESA